jgi:hypothetical protein
MRYRIVGRATNWVADRFPHDRISHEVSQVSVPAKIQATFVCLGIFIYFLFLARKEFRNVRHKKHSWHDRFGMATNIALFGFIETAILIALLTTLFPGASSQIAAAGIWLILLFGILGGASLLAGWVQRKIEDRRRFRMYRDAGLNPKRFIPTAIILLIWLSIFTATELAYFLIQLPTAANPNNDQVYGNGSPGLDLWPAFGLFIFSALGALVSWGLQKFRRIRESTRLVQEYRELLDSQQKDLG